MTRRPNFANAAADFGFAALALVAGVFGAPPLYLAMVFVGAVAAWLWTRRAAFAAMRPERRLPQGAIALAMIAAALAVSYWIGLIAGGHT
jgi:hypothetical protein